jgi:hypothetical protein
MMNEVDKPPNSPDCSLDLVEVEIIYGADVYHCYSGSQSFSMMNIKG